MLAFKWDLGKLLKNLTLGEVCSGLKDVEGSMCVLPGLLTNYLSPAVFR